MLRAEVSTQIHDLPGPETDEEPGGADAEPLDAVVGALVGVAKLLLSETHVVHLADDLGHGLLDASQLGLDGLELLGGLDGGPVLGIGANVDVEFDGAGGRGWSLGLLERGGGVSKGFLLLFIVKQMRATYRKCRCSRSRRRRESRCGK